MLLVGDLFYGGAMMASNLIFEVVSTKGKFINGFQCRGEGFTRGSKPSDSFYVEQSRYKHPTRKMEYVCQTLPKEDRRKKHSRIILRSSSRQLNYLKKPYVFPLFFPFPFNFVEPCKVILILWCGC